MKHEQNIALLIDCDNASYHAIESVLNELAKYGITNIRQAYGNWKNPNLKGWEDPFAITPVQQFAYTQGKNATDAAMIIAAAIDFLYTQNLDAFALMTSDSDFTPLAMRILTNGLKVYGFGEQKTPSPFVNACSQFIYTENIVLSSDENGKNTDAQKDTKKSRKLKGDTKLVKLLRNAAEQTAEEDGWSNLGHVGKYISNNTSFSPINYGYKKLSDLIKDSELFHIKMGNKKSVMHIKDSRKSNDK